MWRVCDASERMIAMKLLLFVLMLGAVMGAQTALPAGAPQPPNPSTPQLEQILGQLEQTAQKTNLDLARLRIEKWKTSSDAKGQAQADLDSLIKNLSAALPEMIAGVRANPAAVAPTFKLYRDVNVVYDVLNGLTESAGAFGPKDQYTELANDSQQLDAMRRSLADYIEQTSSARDAEVLQLRNQVAVAAQKQAAVTKQVIDDTEPAPKPKKKKKGATSKTAPAKATPASQPPSQP